jgi:SAM-dependent methyltransferase
MSEERELLAEQKAYYRARAPEYDDWFLRKGRYDDGPEANRRWFGEVEEVLKALRSFCPGGRVLELACGTGWWTEQLAAHADAVTAVDASEEVLELNRRRLGADPKVSYVLADIFEWAPAEPYDVVFFGFWLSHVPSSARAGFWERVRDSLKPGGRVFFVDSLRSSTRVPWDATGGSGEDSVQLRSVADGREFRVIKNRYDPDRLRSELESMGWKARIRTTQRFFLYGEVAARPRHVLVFAYGSNLDAERMTARVPSARLVGRSRLEHHELRFHKRGSKDGTGKANAFRSDADDAAVHGVVYEIDERGLASLDAHEGGYERRLLSLAVEERGERVDAWVYLARPETIDDALAPEAWYVAHVLAGARAHGLPSHVVEGLTEIRARLPRP